MEEMRTTCDGCKKRDTCKIICKSLELYLGTFGIYSKNWKSPKEYTNKRNAEWDFYNDPAIGIRIIKKEAENQS